MSSSCENWMEKEGYSSRLVGCLKKDAPTLPPPPRVVISELSSPEQGHEYEPRRDGEAPARSVGGQRFEGPKSGLP